MKLVKSLLLGAGAGLALVSGASAADLPSRKAAPVAVEYVRVCSTYGTGFFYLPGTNTCLRVGGRVRAEYLVAETFGRNHDAVGFRARARLNIDSRTATDYGTLRAFFRYEITRNTGTYNYAHADGTGYVLGTPLAGPTSRVGGSGGAVTQAGAVDKAFIQYAAPFGGSVTAGRAGSFYDFYANDTNWGLLRGSDRSGGGTQLLGVTAGPFGGGFSATVAVEDRTETEFTSTSITGPNAFAGQNGPTGFTGFSGVTGQGFANAGQRMPDIVGNVRYDGAFGSAQLSGAVHEIRSSTRFNTLNGAVIGINGVNGDGSFFPDSEYGFAVQGGVKINLPMIAAGDVLWLQGAYADGAISYLGYGGSFGSPLSRAGNLSVNNADALTDGAGNIRTSEGFAVVGSFTHYFTPMLRGSVYGSYSQINYDQAVRPFGFGATATNFGGIGVFGAGATGIDNEEIRVGGQLVFSPVSAFDIGVEVLYTRVETENRLQTSKSASNGGTFTAAGFAANGGVATGFRALRSDDAIQARLRLQRDF